MGKKIKGLFGELDAAMKRNGRRELDKLLRGETKTQAVAKAKAQAGEEIAKLKQENEHLKKQIEVLKGATDGLQKSLADERAKHAETRKELHAASMELTKYKREAAIFQKSMSGRPAPRNIKPFTFYMRNEGDGGQLLSRMAIDRAGIEFIVFDLLRVMVLGSEFKVDYVLNDLRMRLLEDMREVNAARKAQEAAPEFSGDLQADFLGSKEK